MRPRCRPPIRAADVARTVVVAVWVAGATLVCGLRAIFLAAHTHTDADLHAVARTWARSILRVSRVQVSVAGGDRIIPGRPYIIMANHQGNYDILALLGHFPVEFRWLAKAELFRIPLFGRAMRAVGYIPIDRKDRTSAFGSLHLAAGVLNHGVPIVIFPEGTRSPDGRLLPFKKGGFVLAVTSGVPIVPVAIRGCHAIMPKGSRVVRRGEVALTIGRPIATSGMRVEDRDDLMRTVRDTLTQTLARN